MMHLIHRNRFSLFGSCLAKIRSAAVPLPPRGRLKMATQKRIPEKDRSARQSLLRWRRGTAAEAETSSASFDDAVAVDEIHHTTALTHHKISEKIKTKK